MRLLNLPRRLICFLLNLPFILFRLFDDEPIRAEEPADIPPTDTDTGIPRMQLILKLQSFWITTERRFQRFIQMERMHKKIIRLQAELIERLRAEQQIPVNDPIPIVHRSPHWRPAPIRHERFRQR